MSRPLNVINIYVRLRVHQEVKPHYQLAPSLVAAEMQRDPNILLRESQKYLENRFISALDPIEAIRAYTLCVIVGDPGAGKTTLLKYLALKSATQQLPDLPDLPIHIELNAFATSVYEDLLDFASNKWEERYTFPQLEARALMEKSLENGKALLLLDALDETMIGESNEVVDANYKRVTDAITNLATRYYKSPIVVTARKAGYHQRKSLEGFTELEVLDFRRGDIKQFVENWFTYHPNPKRQASATDLNNRLEQNSRIQALAANPLLLSLILIVYEAQLDLPDRRAELYKLCVDTLLTRWDATRDIRRRREFKPEHKRQLLQEVAWHFHNQGRRYFPDDELLKVIADFLPAVDLPAEQNERVLIEIASENSILKPQAQGWHGFLHLTLQEYFVAQHAADRNLTDELLEHLGDPWWDEVILLYSG
ncbi:MAG TPA: NACHT domain-containing protein, partial [Methylomirabilota bacterium]|nr:NACHT domain-containing protein [Methylomirabilota bacterium]